jgi:hypothetical protein
MGEPDIEEPRRRLFPSVTTPSANVRLQSPKKTIKMLENLNTSLRKLVGRQKNCSLGNSLLAESEVGYVGYQVSRALKGY